MSWRVYFFLGWSHLDKLTLLFTSLVTIFVFKRHKGLHTATNFFVASLSSADLISVAIAPFETTMVFSSFGTIWKIYCISIVTCERYIYEVRAFSIILLGIDRYIFIVYPMKYHSIMTTKRIRLLILTSWIAPMLTSGIFLQFNIEEAFNFHIYPCNWLNINLLSRESRSIIRTITLIALIITFCLYLKILQVEWKQRNTVQPQSALRFNHREDFKIASVTASILGAHVLIVAIVGVLMSMGGRMAAGPSGWLAKLALQVTRLEQWLCFVIFVSFSKRFRSNVKKLLKCKHRSKPTVVLNVNSIELHEVSASLN